MSVRWCARGTDRDVEKHWDYAACQIDLDEMFVMEAPSVA